MQLAPQACALRLSSAGHRARPLGHVGERATQRLEAESALVLVSRSCRGGARALPRHSELWSLARMRRENLERGSSCGAIHGTSTNRHGAHCPSKEAPPVVGRRRCGVRAICVFSRAHWAPTSERGWGESLNLTRFISLDAPGRRRCREQAERRWSSALRRRTPVHPCCEKWWASQRASELTARGLVFFYFYLFSSRFHFRWLSVSLDHFISFHYSARI